MPVIFQDDPILASTSAPAKVPAAMDKTTPSLQDVWPLPSTASTPGSGVETVHDSPDSFHSLSDQDSHTILHSRQRTPQSSSASSKKKKSPSSVVQLYQDFQGAAQAVALQITRPPEPPVPRDPSVVSQCPRHSTMIDFIQYSLEEINKRPFKCQQDYHLQEILIHLYHQCCYKTLKNQTPGTEVFHKDTTTL